MDPPAASHPGAAGWHICWQAAPGRDVLAGDSLVERIRARLIAAHRKQGRVLLDYLCPRRSNFDPPCRLNFDPGLVAGIA